MGLASILSISLQGTLSLMTALGGRTGGGLYKSICSRGQRGLLVSVNGNVVSSRKTHPCDLYLDWPIMAGWLEAHGVLLPAGAADISLTYLWLWGTAVQCS